MTISLDRETSQAAVTKLENTVRWTWAEGDVPVSIQGDASSFSSLDELIS